MSHAKVFQDHIRLIEANGDFQMSYDDTKPYLELNKLTVALALALLLTLPLNQTLALSAALNLSLTLILILT